LTYMLYPLNDGRYPQNELVYVNYNTKDGFNDGITEIVKFIALMPRGYVAAFQIPPQEWVGLKGELYIGKS